MREQDRSKIIGNIDKKYIDEAAFAFEDSDAVPGRKWADPKRNTARPGWIRTAVIVASAVLLIAAGLTATVIAADVKEYNEAVAFFADNGLSAEGLSRSEVKAVYRDITEKTFTCDKTAEVLQKAVPGWEIRQDGTEFGSDTSLPEIWSQTDSGFRKGVDYRLVEQYVRNEEYGTDDLKSTVLECRMDGELLWETEFDDLCATDYSCTKDGIAIWGHSGQRSTVTSSFAWIALVGGDGTVKWQRRLDHGFELEDVAAVLNNEDGTWTVISRGHVRYLCLANFDSDGNELFFNKTEVGVYGIRNAKRLGNGYIVQLGSYDPPEAALLYRLDRDGRVMETYSYDSEDSAFHITDMAEFGGRVYLSGYSVPGKADEHSREISGILSKLVPGAVTSETSISPEVLTPMVQDNYTAVLLICDPEEGTPETFYSVKGSLGGKLSVNGTDKLEWDVESIVSTVYSPLTSAWSIAGVCEVFRYEFDESRNLTGQEKTGETVTFAR